MRHIRMFWYGMFIDYHLRKRKTVNSKYKTVHAFHYQMALHYYEKAYGEEFRW